MVYYNQFIYHHLAIGKILILPEDKEQYVVKFDAYTGKFGVTEEEEDMSRPMFVQIIEGRKVEFINISQVVRVEIINPGEGEPGSGTLHLQDGSTRTLGEDEINWAMRVLQGLRGQPVPGTANAPPGYWTGAKAQSEEMGAPPEAASGLVEGSGE